MNPAVFLAIVLALVAGAAVGWFLGIRIANRWRDKFNEAIVNLAAERATAERVEATEADLRRERENGSALAARVAGYERGESERQRAHEAQLAQLKDLETKLEARFGELAGKAVEGAHDLFLKRAEERFGHAGKHNEEKLKAALQPVEALLKGHNESLIKVEKERVDQYAGLLTAVEQMNRINDQARLETSRLSGVLRSSPKARGRWGEEQLRTILESAGLAPNVDFELQATRFDEGQQFRPDCIIKLPGDKCIVVDVKCPLTAFEQAYDEENEEIRQRLLNEHANALKLYANDLSKKSYFDKFENTPEFVIMFIPGEHFLSAAAEKMPALISDAFKNKVVIASTINLLALAKMMAWMWKQDHAAREARQFVEAGKKLHAALRTMAGKIIDLGSRLGKANDSYSEFIGSLERNVLVQAKKLEDLDTMYGEPPVPDLQAVSTPIRRLVKLSPASPEPSE